MRDKTASDDDVQLRALLMKCTKCGWTRFCTHRRLTCPDCRKPTLRRYGQRQPRAPRPIEGRQS